MAKIIGKDSKHSLKATFSKLHVCFLPISFQKTFFQFLSCQTKDVAYLNEKERGKSYFIQIVYKTSLTETIMHPKTSTRLV